LQLQLKSRSKLLQVLGSDGLVGYNTGVASLELLWADKVVHICGDELSFVVRGPVSDDNLR
tara:strand:- start:503 stop:685 length:183 start_codon:yes stop_codon:yes gene_type:complete